MVFLSDVLTEYALDLDRGVVAMVTSLLLPLLLRLWQLRIYPAINWHWGFKFLIYKRHFL